MEPRENGTQTVTQERGTLIAVIVCSHALLHLASLATRNENLARRLATSLLAFEQKRPLEATLLCKLWHRLGTGGEWGGGGFIV